MSDNKITKKYIGQNQVGSSQIELENNQPIKAKSFDGLSSLNIIKLDSSDLLQILKIPYLPGNATDNLQAVAKQQLDSAISGVQSQISSVETYSENIIHIDGTNGVDAIGRGSIMRPYKTINYAYSQVPSAALDINQWTLEKLILKVAAGDYTENVAIGLKRARTAIMGEGVYINGTLTQTWVVTDIPYSGNPSACINGALLPAPYTNFAAPTLELIGFGGGMEAGYVSKNLMIQGLVKIATIPWDTNSSWQSVGTLTAFFLTNHVQLRGGFNVCHDISTYPGSIGPAFTVEVNSSSIEGGYLGVAPFAPGQQLTSLDGYCTLNLKASNSQLKSTLGPRITILEIDGCRIVNIDRTMGGTVTNGSITSQISSSFSGIVNSPFAGSIYKIGRSVGVSAVAYKMDANSYADLQTKTLDNGTAPITYNLIDKASGVAVSGVPVNYTRTSNDVEASLIGIDNALGQKVSETDFISQKVTLSALDITNQYIDLNFKASMNSINLSSQRINLIVVSGVDSDADFKQDNSGSVTRLIFQGPSAIGGVSELSEGQIIYFNYVKL